MGNKQAIEELYKICGDLAVYGTNDFVEPMNLAIKALEENDNLKAEIERLKKRLFAHEKLEKGQELYAIRDGKIFIHKVFTTENRGHLITSMEDDYLIDFLWTDIGVKIFLTREEAEKALKEREVE